MSSALKSLPEFYGMPLTPDEDDEGTRMSNSSVQEIHVQPRNAKIKRTLLFLTNFGMRAL